MKKSLLILAGLAAYAARVAAQPIPDVVVYGRAVQANGSNLSSNAIVSSMTGAVGGFTFSAAAASQGGQNFYILRIPADNSNGIYRRTNAVWINDPTPAHRTLTITISNIVVQQEPLVLTRSGLVRFDIAAGGSAPAPRIVQQPAARSVAFGGYALFAVGATGQTPLHYQWYFNTNQPLPGATNNLLVIEPTQCSGAGKYGVIVTNAVGSITSSWVTLTVTNAAPPTITQQPQGTTASFTNNVLLTVQAAGCSPGYQWYFNGQSIPDATSAILLLPSVRSTNSGLYFAVVANDVGSVTSSVATLIVKDPVILSQSGDQAKGLGEDVTLSVNALGTPTLAYQWVFGSTPIADATNSVLTIPSLQATNQGSYMCMVANGLGASIVSTPIVLTVLPLAPTTISISDRTNLNYSGGAGSRFVLLTSSNATDWLTNWARVDTNPATPGKFSVSVGSQRATFYRIKSE